MKEMQERGVLHRTSTSHGCNHNNTSLYEGISFSAIILRALRDRPANEDQIRGVA